MRSNMRWTRVLLILAVSALAVPRANGALDTAGPVISGIELEGSAERDRVLVFGRGELTHRVVEEAEETLILSFPGASLDPSAPRFVIPDLGGVISKVNLNEPVGGPPEVQLVIQRMAGASAEISVQGAMLAVDFPRPAPGEQSLTLRFVETELAEIVRSVGDATGQAFLFDDDKLKGKVTIFVADRVESAEALEILAAALLLKGFVALPTPGGPLRIVEVSAAAGGAPWSLEPVEDDHTAPITTLIRLSAASAEEIVPALQPWIGRSGHVTAYPPTNSIVLAGSEPRLHTLLTLIRVLDEAAVERVVVRRLRHHRSEELAPMLKSTFENAPGRVNTLSVWSEPQTNALILRAREDVLEEAREWIDEVDQPEIGEGRVRVRSLRYADPEQIAQILRDLASGGGTESVGTSLAGQDFGVAIDAPTASLVLRGEPATLDLVERVIALLDLEPARITVEVLVHEIITGEGLSLGIDAFIPITNPNSVDDTRSALSFNPSGGGLVNPGLDQRDAFAFRYTRSPLVFPIVDDQGNPATVVVPRESVVLTADEREIESRVLLRPQLLVISGEEQEIFAGNNIPIPTQTLGSSDVAAGPSLDVRQDIQRQDVGLVVRVTPNVGQEGDVILELYVDKSRVARSLTGNPQELGVTIEERELSATVRLSPGNFAVVGLGNERALRSQETSTPFLREIPVLRQLVTASEEQWVNTQLVIAVQAWVHRSRADEVADSIRRRLGFERSVARTRDLVDGSGEPYAVLVDTWTTEVEADAIVERFLADGRAAAVGRWEDYGRERFDVYLTGFDSLTDAGEQSVRLVHEGWKPQVVVLPGAKPSPPAM
jgi:general secretion pathway protein D